MAKRQAHQRGGWYYRHEWVRGQRRTTGPFWYNDYLAQMLNMTPTDPAFANEWYERVPAWRLRKAWLRRRDQVKTVIFKCWAWGNKVAEQPLVKPVFTAAVGALAGYLVGRGQC